MAYNGTIFAGTLANINVGVAGALSVLNPLLAQVDLTLFGSLGLGALQANLQAQLQAALEAQVGLAVSLGLEPVLAAIAQLQASLQLGLALPSVDVSLSIGAAAAFAASVGAQIGGLQALIDAAIAVKIPATTLAGQLGAALDAGPVFVISWTAEQLATAGTSVSADFSAGLSSGPNFINPGEITYGVLLVTKAPSAWAGIQALLLTT